MERISFIEFQNRFLNREIITLHDIKKVYPHFQNRRLVEWQNKNYIQKIANTYYTWPGIKNTEGRLFFIANRLCSNSYISLWTAMRWYGFIPEGVYQVLSVTTNKPKSIESDIGNFHYHHVKPDLFYGYLPQKWKDNSFLIAEPEKAICDTFYLNTDLINETDLVSLRLNLKQIKNTVKTNRILSYGILYNNKRVFNLISILLTMINK